MKHHWVTDEKWNSSLFCVSFSLVPSFTPVSSLCNRIFPPLSLHLSSVKTVNKGNCVHQPAHTTAQWGTHKSTLCVSVCVSVYFGWLCFRFASPPPPPSLPPPASQRIQHSHWSKIGAEPHLGTLPPLKQIRPQRLIKNSKALLHRRRGTGEGSHSQLPRADSNELVRDGALLFSRDKKKCPSLQRLHHPPPTPPPLFTVKYFFNVMFLTSPWLKKQTASQIGDKVGVKFPSLDQLLLS